MATSPHQDSGILDCVAKNVLICPCHEGAKREMEALPIEAQVDVWNDLTGAEAVVRRKGLFVEEPASMVEPALRLLSYRLEQLVLQRPKENSSDEKKFSALRLALQEHPDYCLRDPLFLLKFLRADRFDVEATIERLAIHFQCKLELWGRDKLGREIYFSDLDEDDLHSLMTGYFQISPIKDHAGRRIFFYYKALSSCYRKRENLLRAYWYMTNRIATQDETVQQLGVVNVVYNNGGFPPGGMDYEKSRRLAQLFRGNPVRFDSFIVCLDDSPWLSVVEAFSFLVGKYIRVRMRAIQGSHTECLYNLMALGVPQLALPVTEASELLTSSHQKFLSKAQKKDAKVVQEQNARAQAILEQEQQFHKMQQQQPHADFTFLLNGGSSSGGNFFQSSNPLKALLSSTAAHYHIDSSVPDGVATDEDDSGGVSSPPESTRAQAEAYMSIG